MTITPEYLDELERIRNEKGDGPWSIPADWVEFVTACLSSLPALIVEVRRLQKERDELRSERDQWRDCHKIVNTELKTWRGVANESDVFVWDGQWYTSELEWARRTVEEVRRLRQERDELRTIVADFPHTGDGVLIRKGMTVYTCYREKRRVVDAWFNTVVSVGDGENYDVIRAELYYSTPQAAEAAREGK